LKTILLLIIAAAAFGQPSANGVNQPPNLQLTSVVATHFQIMNNAGEPMFVIKPGDTVCNITRDTCTWWPKQADMYHPRNISPRTLAALKEAVQ
jgi:hypothetical protein